MVSSVHNLLDQEAQKADQDLHFVVATLVEQNGVLSRTEREKGKGGIQYAK
jgi:hypothetical protein